MVDVIVFDLEVVCFRLSIESMRNLNMRNVVQRSCQYFNGRSAPIKIYQDIYQSKGLIDGSNILNGSEAIGP